MAWHDDNAKLIGQFIEQIRQQLPPEEAARAEAFAKLYFSSFPLDDIQGRSSGDILASLLGSWRFLQHLDQGAKVRLFNPEFERHGWRTPHTVVAIICTTVTFALNSVRAELNRRNITIFTIHSASFYVRRDEAQQLLSVHAAPEPGAKMETMLYLEINRRTDQVELHELEQALREILDEVGAVVADYELMCERLQSVQKQLLTHRCGDPVLRDELVAFIDWLLADNFTFLGAETVAPLQPPQGGLAPQTARALGLLKRTGNFGQSLVEVEMAEARGSGEVVQPLVFAKAAVRVRVHRRAYPNLISFRLCDEHGALLAEERFLGLFTSRAYTIPPEQIPLIRHKVARVLERSGYREGSHEFAELQRVLELHPRDELFHASIDQLFRTATGIQALRERRLVRLFVRHDARDRFVTCLVYMPRDIYRTELRRRIEALLIETFGAEEAEFFTFFSESVLTRTHFILRVDPERAREYDLHRLEHEVVQATLSWQDHLRNQLVEHFGEERGLQLARQYDEAFPPGYQDDWDPRAAVSDIDKMATLQAPADIAMSLYRSLHDAADFLRFRLFHLGDPLPLSDVMPVLEHLGLRVISERPYEVDRSQGGRVWVHEFCLTYPPVQTTTPAEIDPAEVNSAFQEAFARIWYGDAESDPFNKLILGARLGWRATALLRAYARYMKQMNFFFTGDYIAETLARHLTITRLLVDLFYRRFDPALSAGGGAADEPQDADEEAALEQRIITALDNVDNLSEDRIIRQFVALIKATVRTNFFQRESDGSLKSYISLKFLAQQIPDLPQPRPRYEVFVYSPRMEGVHLRTSKVARGGLRWSDRHEDFRTEILGLVKAQQVKNAVIVPSGAKGGFVAKRTLAGATREQVQEEGIACYRLLIQGLLDLTDNRVNGTVVPPIDVVRKDDDDPYLVVAADKGTASFSDIANGIAADYGFWLGDAFASGGSVGYDHKKMGITARGAWVSVQRHFLSLGINPESETFSVVGIGDMSGDVFGNGMLSSRNIRLLAAFNHQHIFIDPDPDPTLSFEERARLFTLPRSSWADYDSKLISTGGGVFPRSLKSIELTPEMRERFGIDAPRLTPNALIAALLKAPVDLLWNGGIGTYVKASTQSHAEVGDKTNDSVRVDGRELRCRVVAEGGNLGMTQPARVEYALKGGLCNTDFIDNSGGVDCSDHEVNIKIALNPLVAAGDMTEKQRRELLRSMTKKVAELVLANNYRQALALSLAERQALVRHGEYRRLIHRMEASGHLNRSLEYIPDEEGMAERRANGNALTRPELAILMAYTKTQLQTDLIDSDAPDDKLMSRALYEAFPPLLCAQYGPALDAHRLRREITATYIANDMVDLMGITFAERILQSTGATPAEIARGYITAREVFALRDYWQAIAGLDGRVAAGVQMDMMQTLMRLTRRATRWFIRNRRALLDPEREVEHFREPMTQLFGALPTLLRGRLQTDHQGACEALEEQGVPPELAAFVGSADVLYPVLGLIDAAAEIEAPLLKVFEIYQALMLELELDRFAREIAELKVENHWQALARESFRDDLEWQLRKLTVGAMKHLCARGDVDACVARWTEQQAVLVQRWRELMTELNAAETHEFAVYSVAIRELLDLAQSSHVNDRLPD